MIFKTKRLDAYFVKDENKHHIIDLYNRKENIEFIEGRPIRFKREDAKTYPKCEAEINKNKQLLTE